MMVFLGMAGYKRTDTGRLLGDLLKRSVGNAGLNEKEARGDIDKSQWSRMEQGQLAMDLNALVDELPEEPFLDFVARVIALKVGKAKPAKAELRSPAASGKVA